jgi:hypothetical protein
MSSRSNSTFRFLERLKAGFGAAGLVAILGEGLLSSGFAARALGLAIPVAERLSAVGVVVLSIITFFVVSFLTDISEDEVKKESSSK